MIRVGELLELGEWHHGHGDFERAVRDLKQAFENIAEREGLVLGELNMEDLPADHQRVPQPPEAQNMLVCWAEVKAIAGTPQHELESEPQGSILHDLEPKDLERLRLITRRAYAMHNPKAPELTDQRCDEYIDRIAPELIERMVRAGSVH